MKIILLLLALSSQTFSQSTHIEMTQQACQDGHCYSSPAISKNGDIYYIDTFDGIGTEHGTALMTFNNDVPTSLIINQNELISHVKIDSHNKPMVKIGDSLLRYPNYPINSPIFHSNTGRPANTLDWNGDVSFKAYYTSVGTCEGNTTVSNKIVSSSSHNHIEGSITVHNFSLGHILVDSCTATPEAFTSSDFIKVSNNDKFKIYSIFIGNPPNVNSRMYLHQDDQNDLIIADNVILADVNDQGLAVWTVNINDLFFVYQQNMNDLSQPPVLLDTVVIPAGFTTNITAISINNSGDIAYLVRNYQFSTQTFSFQLKFKPFSSLNIQNLLATGDTINGKNISKIRWNHDGLNDTAVMVSSIRYTDGTESIVKSLTRQPQSIGFEVGNVTADSQGIYNIGKISIDNAYQKPPIISDVPVHQDYEVTNSFFRIEDEYFEQGISNIDIGKSVTSAFSMTPPVQNFDEMTVYHQITQTTPNITIQNQTVSIKYLEIGSICTGSCIGICISNIDANSTGNNKESVSFITTYERLVTEQLESTPAGNYYLSKYFQNYITLRDAVFSEPLSFLQFKTLFESWEPAVENLLDGDGSFEITIEMSENLNNTLDLIERVSNPQFKTLINNSRNKMNLYALPGNTIGSFIANNFENSFEDSIFTNNFE